MLHSVALSSALLAFLGGPFLSEAWGQAPPSSEARVAIEVAVDEGVADIVAGPTLQTAKSTYLEDYGVVVTVEVALERPRNPFSTNRDPAQVRRSSEERRAALKDMAIQLLRRHAPTFDGLALDERLTIVIYMMNTNPVDLPDLPTQLVVSAKKQDVSNLGEGAVPSPALSDRVTIREY